MQLRSSIGMRSLGVAALLCLAATFGALAQQPAGTPSQATLTAADFPQTPEGRMKKFDLPEDPGLDPDPAKVFIRLGKQYQIHKFERRWAKMDIGREGWVRPFGNANFDKELYRVDDKSVWVFHELPEPEPEPTPVRRDHSGEVIRNRDWAEDSLKYFREIRPEFAILEPKKSGVVVRFEPSSEGLPVIGSWRNTIDVADMNGDGHLDIIAPPQRGPGGRPSIFLGDGTGKWKRWEGVKFPRSLNYGSVAVGDFNGDKIQDIVVGAHLSGVFAFLGDGKGSFTESSSGLPPKYGTRRVIVADIDRDGDSDIVVISEGPTLQSSDEAQTPIDSRLKAFLNDGKGAKWTEVNIADQHRLIGGDFLSAGDFNGDKYPDFIGSSIYYDGPDILYVSNGKKAWDPVGRGTLIPFMSLYGATAAGRFSSKKKDDAIVSFSRGWPAELDPALVEQPEVMTVVGIDRISWNGRTPVRTSIVRGTADNRIWGMTTADFDRDGNLDIAYTTYKPRQVEILLGDGKGGFASAGVQGAELPANMNYDLRAADVNRDGLPDLVIMYESSETLATRGKNGAIQVFLNRGRS